MRRRDRQREGASLKSAAIAIVRNAFDIVPLTALHHWLLGVDRVWVLDNGSTDGGYFSTKVGTKLHDRFLTSART